MKANVHAITVTLMLDRPRNKKATLFVIAAHIEVVRVGPTKYCFQGFPSIVLDTNVNFI